MVNAVLEERAATTTRCRHCGLPLSRSRRAALGEFCCAGCKSVNALIEGEGLGRYYELRAKSQSPAPEHRPDTFAWLDPLLANLDATNELARLSLDVQGVHCAACVWLLETLWSRHPGGLDLRVNSALGRAEFIWRRGEFDLRDYLRIAERFGYRFGPVRKQDLGKSRGLVVRLGVCAAAAANVMIFSLCFYAGLGRDEGALYRTLGALNFALATIAVLVGGSLFFRSAWQGLRRRVVHLDLPIALGILLGYSGSVWAWLAKGPEAAYFDTIAIFTTLMVLGRWLSERVLQRNRHALLESEGVDDLFTRRRRDGWLETIPASHVEPGDELWILPGDLVPVEGILLGERATMSLDWIDGESRARVFEPGETVPAGAFQIGESAARIGASESFAASRLHGLLGNARRDETNAQRVGREDRWTKRVAEIYVAAVLVLAAVAFALWWHAGSQRAIEVTLSVLVITCPCALGLATPLAHELVHSALRRRGIFLRDDGFLHRALRVRHVLFDKTGTLTRGVLRIGERSRIELAALDLESREVLINACARSLHPISRCILAEFADGADAPRTKLDADLEVREFSGRGVEVRRGARTWRLGSADFALADGGESLEGTHFVVDGRVLARIEVEEELKSDAIDEVRRLESEGRSVHLLSGDRSERVRKVGEQLRIASERVRGELSPEEKAAYVRALDRRDTCMVGDGINDGPAFDAAFTAATPAVDRPNLPARADFFFLGDGVQAVRTTFDAAKRLARVLRGNLIFAVLYNSAAVAACLAGLVGPLAAAVLMPSSSIALLGWTTYRLSGRSSAWTS